MAKKKSPQDRLLEAIYGKPLDEVTKEDIERLKEKYPDAFKGKLMNNEYVYCHLYWVDAVRWRLWCQKNDIGIVRGITREEYERMKPMVESLTIDSFAKIKKLWPHMTGPTKEQIETDITELKKQFKEFDEHPELLGEDLDSITYKDDDWWRPVKPTDKPLLARHNACLWGKHWDWLHDSTIPIPDYLKSEMEQVNFWQNYINEDDR